MERSTEARSHAVRVVHCHASRDVEEADFRVRVVDDDRRTVVPVVDAAANEVDAPGLAVSQSTGARGMGSNTFFSRGDSVVTTSITRRSEARLWPARRLRRAARGLRSSPA